MMICWCKRLEFFLNNRKINLWSNALQTCFGKKRLWDNIKIVDFHNYASSVSYRQTLNFSLSGAFHSMAFRNTALSTDNDSFAITADDVVGNEKTWTTRQQWRGKRWCQGQWREQRPQANLRHMPWPLSGPGDEQVDVSDVGVCTVLMIFMTRVLCLIPYP